MSVSMYQISVPVFTRMLGDLATIFEKAATHCEPRKIDPAALTQFRFYPDMFAFWKQIHIATDAAKMVVLIWLGQSHSSLKTPHEVFMAQLQSHPNVVALQS